MQLRCPPWGWSEPDLRPPPNAGEKEADAYPRHRAQG